MLYQGDLAPARLGSWKTPGMQLGVSASYPVNSLISLRANVVYARLKGDDARYKIPEWRQHRNLKFRSPVLEVSALAVWDILGTTSLNKEEGSGPYAFGGAGVGFMRVRRDASAFDAEYFPASLNLQERIDADLSNSTPRALLVVPVGIGYRYPLNDRLALNGEATYRFSFHDRIDGFSEAGNPKEKDHYYGVTVGLFYRFRNRGGIKCPKL